jgi:hypothetical protein
MEFILAALIAGATAAANDTAGVAVKDAYGALKDLIKKKFAEQGKDNSLLIDKFEKKPELQVAKLLLEDDLKEAGIDKDDEIKKAAEAVDQAVKESQGATGSKYNTTVGGDMKIGIQGDVSGGNINQTF